MDVTYEVASGTRAEGKGATGQLLPRWPPRTPPPALLPLATPNGDHATGDGLHLAPALCAPAAVCDLAHASIGLFVALARRVRRRPRARRRKDDLVPRARGAGELLLDAHGVQFGREVDSRDVVTEASRERGGGR
ncbi:hypothetical protein C8R45DRAFT_1109648 [Mycena sanguinolenta]|nr:hypothetical protein C8R45DRAFT_1109648 [Mycena sanguinolenta]